MSEVKRNHHLPRFYLDAWADDEGKVALRRRGETESRLTSVRNVGVRSRFYTPEAESHFGRTETAAAPIIKSLLSNTGILENSENRQVLAHFTTELMARQPYMATFRGLSDQTFVAILESEGDSDSIFRILRREHGPYVMFEDAEELSREIQVFQQRLEKEFPQLTPDEIEKRIHEVAVDPDASQSLHSMVVEAEGSDIRNGWFSEFLLSRGWLVCESTGKEFITSDQPVFKHPTWLDRNKISLHDTLCFVVSPTILLKMGNESGHRQWGEKEVHELNLYIAKHCNHQIITTPPNAEYLSRIPIGKFRPWLHARSPQAPRKLRRVAN